MERIKVWREREKREARVVRRLIPRGSCSNSNPIIGHSPLTRRRNDSIVLLTSYAEYATILNDRATCAVNSRPRVESASISLLYFYFSSLSYFLSTRHMHGHVEESSPTLLYFAYVRRQRIFKNPSPRGLSLPARDPVVTWPTLILLFFFVQVVSDFL